MLLQTQRFKTAMKKYDIVYSVTAHESPECLWNLYFNIRYFHQGLRVLVIFHCNPALHKEAKAMAPDNTSNPLFHPEPSVKARFTASLFLAHLANYRHIESLGIKFDYFATLASNCMFVRQVNFEAIKETTPNLCVTPSGYSLGDEDRWQAEEFKKNPKLVDVFKFHGVEMVAKIHEGAYFKRDVFGWISEFCRANGITQEAFTSDTLAAEEVILPSLERHATGTLGKRYGVWIPGITLADVKSIAKTGGTLSTVETHYNIVKVPRDMNDEKRKYINSIEV